MVEHKESQTFARVGDLKFPKTCSRADYDSRWCPTFHNRSLINVSACFESSVLFAAREG